METMGDRIVDLMVKNHISRKTLANKAGITESALSRYISDERQPKAETLASLASVLRTTTDYLISGTPSISLFDSPQGDSLFGKERKGHFDNLFEDEKDEPLSSWLDKKIIFNIVDQTNFKMTLSDKEKLKLIRLILDL